MMALDPLLCYPTAAELSCNKESLHCLSSFPNYFHLIILQDHLPFMGYGLIRTDKWPRKKGRTEVTRWQVLGGAKLTAVSGQVIWEESPVILVKDDP